MIVLQGKSACQVQRFIILKISNMEIGDMAESEIPRIFLAWIEWPTRPRKPAGSRAADGSLRRPAKLGIERVRAVA